MAGFLNELLSNSALKNIIDEKYKQKIEREERERNRLDTEAKLNAELAMYSAKNKMATSQKLSEMDIAESRAKAKQAETMKEYGLEIGSTWKNPFTGKVETIKNKLDQETALKSTADWSTNQYEIWKTGKAEDLQNKRIAAAEDRADERNKYATNKSVLTSMSQFYKDLLNKYEEQVPALERNKTFYTNEIRDNISAKNKIENNIKGITQYFQQNLPKTYMKEDGWFSNEYADTPFDLETLSNLPKEELNKIGLTGSQKENFDKMIEGYKLQRAKLIEIETLLKNNTEILNETNSILETKKQKYTEALENFKTSNTDLRDFLKDKVNTNPLKK